MKSFKLNVMALALGIASFASLNAHAATQDLGALSLNAKVATFSQSSGAVADTVFFDVSSTSTLGAAAIVWTFFGSDISGLSATVSNLTGTNYGTFLANTNTYYFSLPSAG